jgi:drug/metabolite transporter (DMT)-like permease
MPAEHVICWVLVVSLPRHAAGHAVHLAGRSQWRRPWVGFAYVAVFSMWLGFFAWYRGLALGGVMRVSQVQLLQPFFWMLLAGAAAGRTAGRPHAGLRPWR